MVLVDDERHEWQEALKRHPGGQEANYEVSGSSVRGFWWLSGTLGTPREHQGGTKEAPRRHPGSTQEAPRRPQEARGILEAKSVKTIVFLSKVA